MNIKSFFKKITQYILIKDFFEMNNIKDLPFIVNMESENTGETLYDFYLGLDELTRKDIKIELEKIIFISNFRANKIANSFANNETVHNAVAETYQDKAMAFYLDNFDLLENVINIYEFYKVSGWKRFETRNTNQNRFEIEGAVDIKADKNLINEEKIDNILESWKEKYKENYFENNKVYPEIINARIYFYDNKYFSFLNIKDGNVSKKIYIVVLPEIDEAIIKMSGNYLQVFTTLETFMKKLAGIAIDMTEEKYNLDYFLPNIENDVFAHSAISDWRVKAINIKNNENILNLKFNKNENSKHFNDMTFFIKNYNIDLDRFEIDTMIFDLNVILSGIDILKKKISLNLKKNKSNLNLLKEDHLIVYKILKEKGIFEGFVKVNV